MRHLLHTKVLQDGERFTKKKKDFQDQGTATWRLCTAMRFKRSRQPQTSGSQPHFQVPGTQHQCIQGSRKSTEKVLAEFIEQMFYQVNLSTDRAKQF